MIGALAVYIGAGLFLLGWFGAVGVYVVEGGEGRAAIQWVKALAIVGVLGGAVMTVGFLLWLAGR